MRPHWSGAATFNKEKIMKTIFAIIILLSITLPIHASDQFMEHELCKWMANTATAIVQNKNNGMSETELIANYLQQNGSYMEQSIVIPLIGRIYSVKQNLDADEIAYIEQQHCGLEMAKYSRDRTNQYAFK